MSQQFTRPSDRADQTIHPTPARPRPGTALASPTGVVWSDGEAESVDFGPADRAKDTARFFPYKQRGSSKKSTPEAVIHRIKTWRPRKRTEEFDPILDFAREGALRVGATSESGATTFLFHLCSLVVWAVAQGQPLDWAVICHRHNVERYSAEAYADDRSGATYRSHLRRAGRILAPDGGWPTPTKPLARRSISAPYAPFQLPRLWRDATEQPTRERRQAAMAVVALGLGAGLDGRWITKVHGLDIASTEAAVLVSVAGRDVPVLAEWERHLLALAELAGDGYLVGPLLSPSKNEANHLISKLVWPEHRGPVDPRRLRSTWIRTHLERGTRMPDLLAASGIATFYGLSDHVAFLEALPGAEGHRHLRGADRRLPFDLTVNEIIEEGGR